jgi:putative ubiquitin-RnfH superfamily antitoxin RatB of RatAB toxin-antitoxin module
MQITQAVRFVQVAHEEWQLSQRNVPFSKNSGLQGQAEPVRTRLRVELQVRQLVADPEQVRHLKSQAAQSYTVVLV